MNIYTPCFSWTMYKENIPSSIPSKPLAAKMRSTKLFLPEGLVTDLPFHKHQSYLSKYVSKYKNISADIGSQSLIYMFSKELHKPSSEQL